MILRCRIFGSQFGHFSGTKNHSPEHENHGTKMKIPVGKRKSHPLSVSSWSPNLCGKRCLSHLPLAILDFRFLQISRNLWQKESENENGCCHYEIFKMIKLFFAIFFRKCVFLMIFVPILDSRIMKSHYIVDFNRLPKMHANVTDLLRNWLRNPLIIWAEHFHLCIFRKIFCRFYFSKQNGKNQKQKQIFLLRRSII